MKFLNEYTDFEPRQDLVEKYREEIEKKYEFISDNNTEYKLVLIDDRIYYLNGPYGFKSKVVNRIFFDMSYDNDIHEPSLRKAIKDWVDYNSK
jgi:hypothetical protein